MHALRCPHCAGPALGVLAKLSLSPLRSRPCGSCGRMLGVPWLRYAVVTLLSSLLPVAGGLLALQWGASMSPGWSAPALVIGVALVSQPALWLHVWWVPLTLRANPHEKHDA